MSAPDLFTNDYTVLKRCRHGYFLFNRNDQFVGRSLDLYGEWCEPEIMTLAQLVRPGDVVLDLGANIGTHTIALANLVTMSGLVVAVEPQRLIYNYLVANVAINNLLHVLCMNNAAGASLGALSVPILNPAASANFGAVSLAGHESGEPVNVITVDTLELSRCRLIKIDVEGMESLVLSGAANTIERLKPFIFVEATSDNTGEVIEILTRFGYDCRWHITTYFNPGNFFENADDVFSEFQPEANLVAFPPDANVVAEGLEKVTGPEDNWRDALARIRKKSGG